MKVCKYIANLTFVDWVLSLLVSVSGATFHIYHPEYTSQCQQTMDRQMSAAFYTGIREKVAHYNNQQKNIAFRWSTYCLKFKHKTLKCNIPGDPVSITKFKEKRKTIKF